MFDNYLSVERMIELEEKLVGEESPPMVLTLVDGTIISGSFYSYDGKYISLF